MERINNYQKPEIQIIQLDPEDSMMLASSLGGDRTPTIGIQETSNTSFWSRNGILNSEK